MVNNNKTIPIPLDVGDRVILNEDMRVDEEGGYSAGILFEDTVTQYVESTGLITFEDSDVGKSELLSLIDEAEGIEILKRETLK